MLRPSLAIHYLNQYLSFEKFANLYFYPKLKKMIIAFALGDMV